MHGDPKFWSLCIRNAAMVLALAGTLPAHARVPAEVPQRAIDLFERADNANAEKKFRQSISLAEQALGYTDVIKHRDQRGTLIQLMIQAGLKDGHPSSLCHVDNLLRLYAVEVSQTFDDPQSRERLLAEIGDARSRLRAKLPANERRVGCPDRNPMVKLPGLAVKTSEPVCEPVERPTVSMDSTVHEQGSTDPKTLEAVEPSARESVEPARESRESVAPASTPSRALPFADDTPRGLQAVLVGSAFVGFSGALMVGMGISLSLYNTRNQANETIYEFAVAEDRPVDAAEEATFDDNFATAATYRKLAIGMGASAGVLLAIGLPTLAVGLHRRRKALKNMAVQPVFGPTQAGVTLSGRF